MYVYIYMNMRYKSGFFLNLSNCNRHLHAQAHTHTNIYIPPRMLYLCYESLHVKLSWKRRSPWSPWLVPFHRKDPIGVDMSRHHFSLVRSIHSECAWHVHLVILNPKVRCTSPESRCKDVFLVSSLLFRKALWMPGSWSWPSCWRWWGFPRMGQQIIPFWSQVVKAMNQLATSHQPAINQPSTSHHSQIQHVSSNLIWSCAGPTSPFQV